MNAPATIHLPESLWSDAERRHRRAISIHCPNEGETKLGFRSEIAEMRDQSAAAMTRCCEEAYPFLAEVARKAATAVYAPMSTRRLCLVLIALRQAMETARAFERAMKPERSANHGGG